MDQLQLQLWVALNIVILIYDYSYYTWLYLMKNRSDFSSIYREFANMVKHKFLIQSKFFVLIMPYI